MLIVSWFICGVLYFFLYSYLFSKLVCKEKFEIKLIWVIFSILIGILYCWVSSYNNYFIRPYLIHFYFLFTFLIMYKEPFIKTLLGILCIIFITLLSEMIFSI